MRRLVPVILAIALALLGGLSLVTYQRLQQSRTEAAGLRADAESTRTRYGAAIEEIAAIQDSLDAIVTGEEGMQVLQTQLDQERSLSQSRGDEAMQRIGVIKAGIERAKDKIQDLETRLHESGVQVTGLQKIISNLRRTVAEKEAVVVQLTARVDSLQTQVTGLQAEVQAGSQTIQEQAAAIEQSRRELGTIYYTVGSKKELRAAGVIVSKGGVLGLGKTLVPSGHIDESLLTPLDTDRESVIRIPAKKAKVLSGQPPASYQLESVGDEMELRILDAQAFRAVKHVIIIKE